MPVPDAHADEPRTEVQGDLYAEWVDAKTQAAAWKNRESKLRGELELQLGSNTGGTVNGRLVVTHRYKKTYATAALIRDNPALTQHYMKTRTVEELDIDEFVLVHPDVAAKYRIREMRLVTGGEADDDGTE